MGRFSRDRRSRHSRVLTNSLAAGCVVQGEAPCRAALRTHVGETTALTGYHTPVPSPPSMHLAASHASTPLHPSRRPGVEEWDKRTAALTRCRTAAEPPSTIGPHGEMPRVLAVRVSDGQAVTLATCSPRSERMQRRAGSALVLEHLVRLTTGRHSDGSRWLRGPELSLLLPDPVLLPRRCLVAASRQQSLIVLHPWLVGKRFSHRCPPRHGDSKYVSLNIRDPMGSVSAQTAPAAETRG